MKILHLSSSYPYTDLYKNLLQELDNEGIEQIMYISAKETNLANNRIIENNRRTKYIFSQPFNKLDRYIYYTKISKLTSDVENRIDLNEINLLHTHFLFSDGGVAYKLKKNYGIKYIVAVRNADVNFFFKYGIHIRKYGINILKEASKIIFISPKYKESVIEKIVPKELQNEIYRKSFVVPNGIDEFWLNNINYGKKEKVNFKEINLIFVGELNKNKNVINTIKSTNLLIKKGYKVSFNIIGKGPMEEEIKNLIKSTNNEENIHLLGFVKSKEKLLELYRTADMFLMPSYHETFGLVYIEAMSQGLPVMYSRNQGIDGYFNEGEVGYSVSPDDPEEIARKIEKLIINYNTIFPSTIKKAPEFNWKIIANKYIDLYKDIIQK